MCETFARALAAVHDDGRELPPMPIAWLITIAHNALIVSVRRGRAANDTRRRLALEPLVLTDQDLQAIDQAASDEDLRATLERLLPPDQFRASKAWVFD